MHRKKKKKIKKKMANIRLALVAQYGRALDF